MVLIECEGLRWDMWSESEMQYGYLINALMLLLQLSVCTLREIL